MSLKQQLTQKIEQRLSPQQIQLMKLLQVPTMELEQRIKQEIEENPALEEGNDKDESEFDDDSEFSNAEDTDDSFDFSEYFDDDSPDYKTQVNNRAKDDEERVMPLSGEKSFNEKLIEQLNLFDFDGEDKIIAEILIGNFDESGYLSRNLDAIVDDLAFSYNIQTTVNHLEKILFQIQECEPAGIGARNLKECLLIQINRKLEGDITLFTAKKILENHFEEFTKKHYDKIQKKLDIEEDDLKEAIKEIIRLNPKPGGSLKDNVKSSIQIIPDFQIIENEGKLELSLNGKNAPELKVSKDYEQMMRAYSEGAKSSKSDKEALTFVKQKLENAKWFIDAIKQRQETLLLTMHSIMEYQKKFFLTGDEATLRPMILKDISEKIGLDISTISRVANSKFVQCNYGVLPLKFFFSESMSTEHGEEVSTREVKIILSEAIENENKEKPLTDDSLAALLKKKGYNIARRTVAKYREQLNFPVARLRKEL